MKKINVLDILCDEKIKQVELETKNFESCITDFQECIDEYIIPFLEVNQSLYGLDFQVNVNSSDELEKKKSIVLLELLSRGFKGLISTNPYIFKEYLKEDNDFEGACSHICFLVMFGNIIEYKKVLAKIK